MTQKQTVLVADDSRLIHRIIHTRIEDLGAEVIDAYDGESALAMIKEKKPDLVLMDIELPDMSGFEACQLIKQDPKTYDTAVIFISGADGTFNKVKAFDVGAVDYVAKPFDPAELRARVRAALTTKALLDLLTEQAQIDGLTRLHNRRHFDERIGHELSAGKRYGRSVGLLMLDVDHFKKINDTYGHPKGDQVLKQIADRLRTVGRDSDVACRYGGEEMTIILTESSPTDTYQAGMRLLEEIRSCPQLASMVNKPVTVSIGAACVAPGEDIGAEELVRQADCALYAAKSAGRNRVATFYDSSKVSAA